MKYPRVAFFLGVFPCVLAGWLIGANTVSAEESGPRCEAVYHESGIEPYGQVFSLRPGQEIVLPDFRLRIATAAETARTLKLRNVNGTEQLVEVPARRAGAGPHEFEFDGRRYVVETIRSVSEYRALSRDELAIWPHAEYRAALSAMPAQ